MSIRKFPFITASYLITYIFVFFYVPNDAISLSYKRKQNYWTLYTYSFGHLGLSHFLQNMAVIVPASIIIEYYKWHLFLFTVYSASKIFGGLYAGFNGYFFNTCHIYYVGSSAGGYGLLGILYGLLLTDNLNIFMKLLCIIAPSLSIAGYIFFSLTTKTNVCDSCHIGGFISGFLLTLLYHNKYGAISGIMNGINLGASVFNYLVTGC